jgi:Bacteriocin-protection, YdeI or OmpD-Associated/Domain of unknown function (DUF1905)
LKLKSELLMFGNNTGFEIPDSFVEELGGGKKPKVVATVNGFTFRSSIAHMGGQYLLGVSKERREAAGIAGGDVLELEIELDTAPRVVEVPPELATAFVANPKAKQFWDTISFSNQRWHAEQIERAKTDETRARRVAKSIGLLNEGKAR